MKHVHRSRRRNRGQALVEFALVFPIFLLLLFGLIDLSRFALVANGVNQVAREAARVGAVAGWTETCVAPGSTRHSCIVEVAAGRLTGATPTSTTAQCFRVVNASGTPVSPTANANGCAAGDILRVQVQVANFRAITPIISNIVGPRTLTGMADVAVNN